MSLALHCWMGESLLRAPVSEMTYTVSSGTLNSSIPYHTVHSRHWRWSFPCSVANAGVYQYQAETSTEKNACGRRPSGVSTLVQRCYPCVPRSPINLHTWQTTATARQPKGTVAYSEVTASSWATAPVVRRKRRTHIGNTAFFLLYRQGRINEGTFAPSFRGRWVLSSTLPSEKASCQLDGKRPMWFRRRKPIRLSWSKQISDQSRWFRRWASC